MMRAMGIVVLGIAAMLPSGVLSAKELGVSFTMTSDGPLELERAVRPYRDCVTDWVSRNHGAYEAIVGKMNFREGPAECAAERQRSAEAGLAALDDDLDEAARRKLVRQELLTIDISTFSGLVWESQNLTENQ